MPSNYSIWFVAFSLLGYFSTRRESSNTLPGIKVRKLEGRTGMITPGSEMICDGKSRIPKI